jgi:hypothetical protein
MDYKVASNIRGKSFSDLMSDKISGGKGIGSSIRGAISDKLKAKVTGIKEKFDPMNIARAVTGGSRLGPAVLGRLTGRSQADIDYFAGNKNKKSSYTQVPNSLSTPGENLGGSAVSVLNKMLSFMVSSREEDKKKKDTAKQFTEEQRVEDQRRHNEFLSILREYTSLSVTTTQVKKDDGGLFDAQFDKLKKMLDDINVLKNPKALASLIGLLTNPLALTIGGVLAAAYGLKKVAELIPNANVTTPQQAQNALQYGSQADIKAFGGYDFLAKRITEGPKQAQKALDDYAAGKLTTNELNKLGGETKLKEIAKQTGLKVPEQKQLPATVTPRPKARGYKQIQWDTAYADDYNPDGMRKGLATPLTNAPPPKSVTPSAVGSEKVPVNPPTVTPSLEENKTTPIPSAPMSSRMNDAVSENQTLSLDTPGNTQTPVAPIISTINNSTNTQDKPIPATATVRDTTPILDHVVQMSVVPI